MLYTKLNEVSEMATVGNVPTPNNKIEIVTPLPLADLQVIVDGMNQYMRRNQNPEQFEVLGSGHFGTVFGYKGYAIKLVRGGQSSYRGYGDSRSTDEILDAYVLRQLQSVPSIPRLYGVMDNQVIIMERIDGMTLRQYEDQMEDVTKMDNFIHVDFIKLHREIMKDILMAGWIPVDLHMDNVMIDKATGKPRIIDVGLFKKMDKDNLELRGNDRENLFLRDFWQADDACGYARRMKQYVDERKFPQLLEERRTELIEQEAERKRYKAVREERRRKEEEERQKRLAERVERIAHAENEFGEVRRGIHMWADFAEKVERFRPMPVAQFFDIHQHVDMIQPIRFDMPDIDLDVQQPPENAEQFIQQRKKNRFKDGLHNMFKGNKHAFMADVHKNKFAIGR